jgi:DNA polymerase V
VQAHRTLTVAGTLTVFFHTNRYRPDRPQRDGAYGFTKAGILLDDLVRFEDQPLTLFVSTKGTPSFPL